MLLCCGWPVHLTVVYNSVVECCYRGAGRQSPNTFGHTICRIQRARCTDKATLIIFNHLLCVSFVCAQILIGELCAFFTKAEGTQEKTIVTADCCYFNPLLRRIIRFLGKHTILYKKNPVLFAGPLRYIFVSRCVVFTSGVRDKLKKIEITRKKKGWLVRTWPATLQNLPTRARTCSC